ncbi:Actin-related protein [Cynara cardunculus var. scolymus]|uniref:Actin-related protein n=1 Tax=Cynara cardunculus var. scolymus TaxID=59895 RepID=A0A124SHQ6_CYNCS|nr:Actin-related protein [Cynara cardunculus var. scolymus]
MAFLFKKILESANPLNSSSSTSSSTSNYSVSSHVSLSDQIIVCSSSTGEFDRIPLDIFMQILKLLGPKEAAKLTVICKSWKLIVSDNMFWISYLQNQQGPWDSMFFAETNLRSGYPLRTYPSRMQSFMHIYGQRAQVPGAIIIDGGSGYCKFGWSKYDSPSGWAATFLEFGNIESPMYSRLRHFFATMMHVKSSTQPTVVSIPITHSDNTQAAKTARRQLKEAIYSALFDMNVPSVCAVSQATLALFAARRTSGIVVNIGFNQTSVVPILHGKIMHNVGVEAVGVGALKLTGYLREQMQQRNLPELRKDTEGSYEVPVEVALCVDHCHAAGLTPDETWFKTIVLAGGTACLPGLVERLEKELHLILPSSQSNGILEHLSKFLVHHKEGIQTKVQKKLHVVIFGD